MINKLFQTAKISANYWTDHNVTLHKKFQSPEESLDYFHWRNTQYIDYIKLMPVKDHDNEVIVDFGCGPGNDLVGLGFYSKPSRLIGMDVSTTSLLEARNRLDLHEISCEFIKLDPESSYIPIDSNAIDYIHCSGVLMVLPRPKETLLEFYRILKPGGKCRLMVYNHDSIWLHLYVAFILMTTDQRYENLEIEEAFMRSTDGFECPLSRKWRISEMLELFKSVGFEGKHLGNAISIIEMSHLPKRFEALMNQSLPKESRDFLSQLKFDDRGVPYFNGNAAGIDGCYEIEK